MASDDRDKELDDEFEEQLGRVKKRGFALPVRPSELVKAWKQTKPVTTSAAFDRKVSQLIDAARNRRSRTLGQVFAGWRKAVGLSARDLASRLQRHEDVIRDLEADRMYPETLDVKHWQSYARFVQQSPGTLADLIESYDRATITISGSAAARSTDALSRDARSAFLTDDATTAQLDEKRRRLVAQLRESPG